MLKRVVPLVAAAIIGTAGLSMIKSHEGLRTTAYRDVVGIPTICYGHTGPDVRMGMTLTEPQCEQLLLADIQKHQAPIIPGNPRNCIGNRQLTANQRDAVTSFTFNVGTGAFCNSTMARRLKAGDMIGAADQFPRWNKAGGRVWKGLTRRRREERMLFLTIPRPEPGNALSGRATALLG